MERGSWNGWAATVTSYRFFRRWGLTAEFGGAGDDGARQNSFLFGGTYRGFERKRFALTGRILAGATRWLPNASTFGTDPEQTALTFGLGQAIDLKFSENLALRVQPDLNFVRRQDSGGATRTTLARPISIGVVYKFGRR